MHRRRIPGEIVDGRWPGLYRLRFNLEGADKVSIIIPSVAGPDALRDCVRSIEEGTSYRNYEVVVIDTGCLDEDTSGYLGSRSHRLISSKDSLESLTADQPWCRAMPRAHTSCYFMDDTRVISDDWITSMLGFCRQPEMGAVGAKLFDRKDCINVLQRVCLGHLRG